MFDSLKSLLSSGIVEKLSIDPGKSKEILSGSVEGFIDYAHTLGFTLTTDQATAAMLQLKKMLEAVDMLDSSGAGNDDYNWYSNND